MHLSAIKEYCTHNSQDCTRLCLVQLLDCYNYSYNCSLIALKCMQLPIQNVTGFRKTDPNHTIAILRITNLKYLITHCEFLRLGCSHTKFTV